MTRHFRGFPVPGLGMFHVMCSGALDFTDVILIGKRECVLYCELVINSKCMSFVRFAAQ